MVTLAARAFAQPRSSAVDQSSGCPFKWQYARNRATNVVSRRKIGALASARGKIAVRYLIRIKAAQRMREFLPRAHEISSMRNRVIERLRVSQFEITIRVLLRPRRSTNANSAGRIRVTKAVAKTVTCRLARLFAGCRFRARLGAPEMTR